VPDSHIEFTLDLHIAQAAQWWHHNSLTSFLALDPLEQAYLVAVFEATNDIKAVQMNEAAKDAKKKNKG
jgi:hypothetical protein